jgi:hypothetical protein
LMPEPPGSQRFDARYPCLRYNPEIVQRVSRRLPACTPPMARVLRPLRVACRVRSWGSGRLKRRRVNNAG